jgi:hypothetical protein
MRTLPNEFSFIVLQLLLPHLLMHIYIIFLEIFTLFHLQLVLGITVMRLFLQSKPFAKLLKRNIYKNNLTIYILKIQIMNNSL